MTFNTKIAVALFAASAGVFGVSSHAFAGEGAAAGSAAFSVNNNQVTGAAVSAAVGKQNAAATATNVGGGLLGGVLGSTNSASAAGSAGNVTLTAGNNGVVTKIETTSETIATLGTAQGNELTHQSNLNPANGNLVQIGQQP